jgi:DmsE family decaheme c-type cytochrome
MRFLTPVLLFSSILVAGAAIQPAAAQADAGAYDDSDCAMCHEDVVAAFQKTGHARAPGWGDEGGCQSCHGPGDAHIDEGGDPEKIIRFGTLSAAESSDHCLACHQTQEKHFSARQGIHRLGDVGCVECHNPHSTAETMLREKGAALCSQCHQAVAARFGMPRSHPMAETGPGCVSCHEPHAAGNEHPSRTAMDDGCGRCHFEKTGPFVYSHDTLLVDGCGTCHEVHGSTGRHLLVYESQVNLCYGCHSAGVTPGWHSAPRFLNQKCTACHTAIHGSNTSQFFLEE